MAMPEKSTTPTSKKTKAQLLAELEQLRRRLAALEPALPPQANAGEPAAYQIDFRRLTENAQDIIYRMGLPDGRYEYVSPSAAELFGYTPQEMYNTPLLIREIIHPDWQNYFVEQWQNLLAGQMPPLYEYKIVHKSGHEKWVHQRNVLVKNSQGQPVAIEGIVTDITALKETEEKLRTSQERYRAIVEDQTEFVGRFLPNGILTFANHAYFKYFNENPETALGRPFTNRIPNDDAQMVLAHLASLTPENPVDAIEHRSIVNGEVCWQRWVNRAIFDHSGQLVEFQCVGRDITLRKQAEEALRAGEERYRTLFENAVMGLYRTTPAGQIVMANPALLQMLGYRSLEELTVRNLTNGGFFPGNSRDTFKEVVESQGQVIGLEAVWLKRDGSRLYVRESAKAIRDTAGQTQYYEGTVEDISVRKRVELALRESEERFRTLVSNIPGAVFRCEIDDDWTTRFISETIQEITGFPAPDFLNNRARSFASIIHPDDRADVAGKINEVTQTGKPYSIEYRIINAAGQPKWVWERGQVITGRDRFIDGIILPISQRKQTEALLQKSEERFRRVIHSISDHIYMAELNENGSTVDHYVSPNVVELTGYPWEKFLADWRFWSSVVIHPHDRELAATPAARLAAGQDNEVEYRLIRANGSVIWVRDNARVEHGPVSTMVYGVVSNITARKGAELALQQHTDRLNHLHQIDQAILAAQTPQEIAQTALTHLRRMAHADAASVVLANFETRTVMVLAASTPAGAAVRYGPYTFEPGTHIPMEAFGNISDLLAGNYRLIDDIDTAENIFPQETFIGQAQVRAFITMPLKVHTELIGALSLGALQPGAFSTAHLAVIREVADLLAIAIRQANLQEQTRHYAEELEQRVADRTRELSALYEITAVASESLTLPDTLEQVLGRVVTAMQVQAGNIHLLSQAGDGLDMIAQRGLPPEVIAGLTNIPVDFGLPGWVIKTGEPLIVADVATDERTVQRENTIFKAYAGVPMRARGQVVGVLGVSRHKKYPHFNVEELALLTSIADQVAVVVDSARLRQQAEQMAVMAERERLARDLHDSVTQLLYSANLFAKAAHQAFLAGKLAEMETYLRDIGDIVLQALKEMRLMVYELRPPVLEQDGLVGALQLRLDAVEGRSGVQGRLLAHGYLALPGRVEQALYLVAQEALNNTLKHAEATTVTVTLETIPGKVRLIIADNGRGFNPETGYSGGGLGLVSMQQRIEKLHGTLTIESAPHQGTTVLAEVPGE